MGKSFFLMMCFVAFSSLLSACNSPSITIPSATFTFTPTLLTNTPSSTATFTQAPTVQALAIPPTITLTPKPIPPYQPNLGDLFWHWGGNSNTYQVWINNLELMCYQWICPDDNSNHKYKNSWVYIGQANNSASFTFPFPAKDIVISWGTGERFAFDALIGIIGDKTVGYGYTIEGEPSATWMDSSNIFMKTQIQFDYPNCRLLTSSGVVGKMPDHNYNITGEGGGILFRFIDTSCTKLLQERPPIAAGDHAYLLNGIVITVKPASKLVSTDIISP